MSIDLMKKFLLQTTVVNGRLKYGSDALRDAISKHEGHEVEITIARKERTRSNAQNAYYHGCIIPFLIQGVEDMWGEKLNKAEAHEFLKQRFLSVEKVNEATGEVVRIPKKSSENSTVEQEQYHEDCRRFIQEWFGLVVPLPNEELTMSFGQ